MRNELIKLEAELKDLSKTYNINNTYRQKYYEKLKQTVLLKLKIAKSDQSSPRRRYYSEKINEHLTWYKEFGLIEADSGAIYSERELLDTDLKNADLNTVRLIHSIKQFGFTIAMPDGTFAESFREQ